MGWCISFLLLVTGAAAASAGRVGWHWTSTTGRCELPEARGALLGTSGCSLVQFTQRLEKTVALETGSSELEEEETTGESKSSPASSTCPELCGSDECIGSDKSGAAYVDGRCVGFCVEVDGRHYCEDSDHGDVNCTMCAAGGAPERRVAKPAYEVPALKPFVTPSYEMPALAPPCPALCSSDECLGSRKSGAAYIDGQCVGFCVHVNGKHYCADVDHDHGGVDCTMCAAPAAAPERRIAKPGYGVPAIMPPQERTFEAVDGGVDRCCRGAHAGDNDPSYYDVRYVESPDACENLCRAEPMCKAIEYNAVSGRCEVWTRSVQASRAAANYMCFRYRYTVHTVSIR